MGEALDHGADYVLPVPVHTLAETEAFVPVVDGYPHGLTDTAFSFRSAYDPQTRTTVSVLGSSSEGAWRVIAALKVGQT